MKFYKSLFLPFVPNFGSYIKIEDDDKLTYVERWRESYSLKIDEITPKFTAKGWYGTIFGYGNIQLDAGGVPEVIEKIISADRLTQAIRSRKNKQKPPTVGKTQNPNKPELPKRKQRKVP